MLQQLKRAGLLCLCLGLFSCSQPADQNVHDVQLGYSRTGQGFELVMNDGRRLEARLAGIRMPYQLVHPQSSQSARSMLDQRIAELSNSVSITIHGEPDRYGRLIVSLNDNGGDLAQNLISDDHFMVWPNRKEELDYAGLYAVEKIARAGLNGAWGEGAFHVLGPDPNALAQHLDGPVIVQGRVIDVGRSRDGRVFLNFGLDWRSDFTVIADEDALERAQAYGLDLDSLGGAVIRVRGWLSEANGPAIYLNHPAQIELVDAPEPTRLPRRD